MFYRRSPLLDRLLRRRDGCTDPLGDTRDERPAATEFESITHEQSRMNLGKQSSEKVVTLPPTARQLAPFSLSTSFWGSIKTAAVSIFRISMEQSSYLDGSDPLQRG